jgi:hypothetical protein
LNHLGVISGSLVIPQFSAKIDCTFGPGISHWLVVSTLAPAMKMKFD